MNPKLILEIAKFLGKNLKWVGLAIAAGGTVVILAYLERKKEKLENAKNEAEIVAKSYLDKVNELENELIQIRDERYKEYEENIRKWKELYRKKKAEAENYARKLEKAERLIAKLEKYK